MLIYATLKLRYALLNKCSLCLVKDNLLKSLHKYLHSCPQLIDVFTFHF